MTVSQSTAIDSSIPIEDPIRFETAGVATASGAHFFHDLYTSFLAPLLPVLIESLSLTKTAAGLLAVYREAVTSHRQARARSTCLDNAASW